MAHQFYFLCPACQNDAGFDEGVCSQCGVAVKLSNSGMVVDGRYLTCPQYFEQSKRILALRLQKGESITSGYAGLYYKAGHFRMHGYHHMFYRQITRGYQKAEGRLIIDEKRLRFAGEDFVWNCAFEDVLCVTTTGHHLQVKLRSVGHVRIHFHDESPLKYQTLLRLWLIKNYREQHGCQVLEFQPTVRYKPLSLPEKPLTIKQTASVSRPFYLETLGMNTIAFLVRQVSRLFMTVEIRGRENWGDGRSGMAIMNHQSTVDPFIFGAFFDYRTAFLTKSTVFANPVARFFMRWARGIPTTRYQGDPLVIRHALRLLAAGLRVGVFPEGERTWDGDVLPMRMATVKLLIALRQPVYPVVIDGAFQLLPRWKRWPVKQNIVFHICPPFSLLGDPWSITEQCEFLRNYFQSVLQSSN